MEEFLRKKFINPDELGKRPGFTQVIRVEGASKLIFVSGQTSQDAAGNVTGVGDIKAQAEKAFSKIDDALRSANASFKDVVKMVVYLRNVDDLQAYREVRNKYINVNEPPTSTVVQISSLAHKDYLIEVEVEAVVG